MTLGIISFLWLTYVLTPLAAMSIILMISFHEYCHLRKAKQLGCQTKGMYFLPMLGMVAIIDDFQNDAYVENRVAIAGPIGGLVLTTIICLVGWIYNIPILLAIATIGAVINVFNLVPVYPLDGGRIFKSVAFSIGYKTGIIILIMGAILGVVWFVCWDTNAVIGIVAFMAILSVFAVPLYHKQYPQFKKMTFTQGLVTVIAFVMMLIWGFLIATPGLTLNQKFGKSVERQTTIQLYGKLFPSQLRELREIKEK